MALPFQNNLLYLKSLAQELDSQASRVRHLIGDSHWLSDGHHKEYTLLSILNRHLPHGVLAGRGFVISPQLDGLVSSEQDILILDSLIEAPPFHQSGLIVAFPRQVVAVISVKTTLRKADVRDAIKGMESLRRIANKYAPTQSVWYGLFFFSPDDNVNKNPSIIYNYLNECISDLEKDESSPFHFVNKRLPLDFLACSGDYAFKLRPTDTTNVENTPQRYTGHLCEGIAPALFITDLLDHIANTRNPSQAELINLTDSIELLPIRASTNSS